MTKQRVTRTIVEQLAIGKVAKTRAQASWIIFDDDTMTVKLTSPVLRKPVTTTVHLPNWNETTSIVERSAYAYHQALLRLSIRIKRPIFYVQYSLVAPYDISHTPTE